MIKTIYLKPDEEIISVIDRVVESDADQINLVVPARAQIWQNSINLKLLKRQADDFSKKLTLVVADELETDVAEKIGFAVKKEKDFPVELIREEPEETEEVPEEQPIEQDQPRREVDELIDDSQPDQEAEQKQDVLQEDVRLTASKDALAKEADNDMIGLLVKELKPDKEPAADLAAYGKEDSQRRMADIVNPEVKRKRFSLSSPFKKKIKIEQEPVKIKQAPEQKAKKPLFTTLRQDSAEQVVMQEIEKRSSRSWPKFVFIFLGLAVVAAVLIGYMVLPKAEVSISPRTEEMSFELELVGDLSIDQVNFSLNKIPLQEIKIEKTKTKEFAATGEKQVSTKATGLITIYNEYSSADQTLVATTRFESSGGKTFRINKNVIVPGAAIDEGKIVASSIEVEVTADQPGDSYNIGPADFTIPGFKGSPKFAGFYGKSFSAMSGGSDKTVKVVSQDDIDKGKDQLQKELEDEISQAIGSQIPDDLGLIKDGLRQEISDLSEVEEGDAVDSFVLEFEAVVSALLYNQEDLKELVDADLASQISQDREPFSDTQDISWDDPAIDWTQGKVLISLNVTEDAIYKINIDRIKDDLAGKKEIEIREYFSSRSDIEKARVSFWPFWVKKAPKSKDKIQVVIEAGNEPN